jgi:DNA ligase D-like protein (predicted 3'-phosphoesterase)
MSKSNSWLQEYRKKRDFDRTSEPFGARQTKKKTEPVFVIQKHDASKLHYDFRIEVDGVLKSWAVPKGPSTDPQEKRLAVQTEDHPLEYAEFEGIIPEGEYGAGTVVIWDAGTYENISEGSDDKKVSISEALENGVASVELQGKKLKGAYSLIRMGKKDSDQWLLVKKADKEADARRKPTSTQPESVASGRTLDEVEEEEEPEGEEKDD